MWWPNAFVAEAEIKLHFDLALGAEEEAGHA